MDASSPCPLSPETGGGVPTVGEIWRRPLPHLDGKATTRLVCRTVLTLFHRQVLEFEGLEHISSDQDPFILALNHSQRPEAVLVPAWLCFHRGGRMVHFLADWNFQLVPGLAWLIRLHDPIHVVRKDARPRFLNRFKDRYRHLPPPFTEARRRLAEGRSIGLFPEGTVNRHPELLLRGQTGAARLAQEAGVPVIPGGIRFPRHRDGHPVGDREPFSVRFGAPIQPGTTDPNAAEFHNRIMATLSTLSGKQWQPDARRTKYAFCKT
ncbi:MAG: hypothetical protein RIS76_4481 [Verrucomicrobiota bacterium]